MTPLLLATLYFGVIGAATLRLLGRTPSARVEWAGSALLHGIGATGLLAFLAGTLGIPLQAVFFAMVFGTGVVVIVAFRSPHWSRDEGARERVSVVGIVLTLLLLVPIVGVLVDAAMVPLADYDGRVTWMLKARAIAHEHSITGPFFRGETSRNAHSHYPLLMPTAAAGMLELMQSDDDHAARPTWALAAVGFLLTLYAALRQAARRDAAIAITVAVGWLPVLNGQIDGGFFSAYADVPLMAFTALALLSILRGDPLSNPSQFGLQLAFVVCTKNEGMVLALVLLAVAVAGRRAMRWKPSIVSAAIAIGALAVLALWRSRIPLEHDENYPQLVTALVQHIGRYPAAARALCSRMLDFRAWGLFCPLAALGAATALARKESRRVAAVLIAAIAAILFVYVTTYAVTNWQSIEELAVSSANRLLMHLVPFAALLLASGAGALEPTPPPDAR